MPEYSIYDLSKTKVGTIDLNSELFEAPIKEHLFYYVVNWQNAKSRAGTSSTKTRGMVRGGSKKPWRQKGTGNARAGTIRSPLWRGGGIIFGPKPKDWSFKLNSKIRKSALISALSLKHKNGSINIVNNFDLKEIKTKQVAEFIKTFEFKKALLVIDGDNENLAMSARNIKNIKIIKREGLNVYDLLRFESVIFTEDSVRKVMEALSN